MPVAIGFGNGKQFEDENIQEMLTKLWSLATSNNKFQAKYRGEMKDKINITNKNNHYKRKIRRIILVVGPLCLTAARREKLKKIKIK